LEIEAVNALLVFSTFIKGLALIPVRCMMLEDY